MHNQVTSDLSGRLFTNNYLLDLLFINNYGKIFRQCLLHRAGFQHLIAAATATAVVYFCSSIYYLSSWHRCPNPNSNRKVVQKKKNSIALLLSSAISAKHVHYEPIPQHSVRQASALTTTLARIRTISVKVPYLNRINEKKKYNRLLMH